MKKQPNKKLVGMFTLAGILMFLGAIVLFLGDKIFVKDEDFMVMYFEESVKGLYVGSPVVFKGVEIGKVRKIDLVTDVQDVDYRIPVYIEFHKDKFKSMDRKDMDEEELFLEIIEKGLKARLQTQSLLTGQLMVELELIPEVEPVFRGAKGDMEIPTILSPMGVLSEGVKDLNIKETIESLNQVLKTMNDYLPGLLANATESMDNIRKITSEKNSDRELMVDNFNKTMRDVGDAAQSMKNFTDYLERHPESLLKGKQGGY